MFKPEAGKPALQQMWCQHSGSSPIGAQRRPGATLGRRQDLMRLFSRRLAHCFLCTSHVSILLPLLCATHVDAIETPFATLVIAFNAGVGGAFGYTNASSVLGSPERYTGEGLIPQCVTPYQPPFLQSEIISLGVGGAITIAFDHDVVNDPRNAFGVDLLVFGNAFFSDQGGAIVAGLASEAGSIDVSQDGVTWIHVLGVGPESLFPTRGFLDTSAYATIAGSMPTDFTKPVDPSLTMKDLIGLDYDALQLEYGNSGGGVGIDLATLQLEWIRFVRVRGASVSGQSPEVDAFADVSPEGAIEDLNGDGVVGAADLAMLLGAWGTRGNAADFDGDGSTGATDLARLLSVWSTP